MTQNVWTRLGMDPEDKSTWHTLRTNMPSHRTFDASELAPRAWAAICELCGGEVSRQNTYHQPVFARATKKTKNQKKNPCTYPPRLTPQIPTPLSRTASTRPPNTGATPSS